jgi:large exoprotein involved in heme utilization and adhesion
MPKATAVPKNRTVSFQVRARPTKSQVGNAVILMGETKIVATDTVANVEIQTTRPSLTTKFDTDPAYTEGRDRVLP